MDRPSSIVRFSRGAVAALAWLFAAGVAAQVFLVGWSVFDDPTRWPDHVAVGRSLGLLPLPRLLLALAGRLPTRLTGGAGLVVILYALQFALANAGGAVSALHAVNALALFWLALWLGQQVRRLAPPAAAAAPRVGAR